MYGGSIGSSGALGLEIIKQSGARIPVREPVAWPARAVTAADVVQHGMPQSGLPDDVNAWRLRNLRHLWRGARRVALARALRLPHFYGQLWLSVIRSDGRVEDLGLASMRVVTTAGVNFLVDAFQNSVELENLKYHALGTGTNAEASGDTALQTELTTQYSTNNTRPTGTTTEGASANIYRTVATITVDATVAATEHGILDQASNAGGTLWDRTVFTVVNLASGDSIAATYDATFTAGS